MFLDRHRDALLGHGVLYPVTDGTYEASGRSAYAKPKHQWMVAALMAPSDVSFWQGIDGALAEAGDGVHTLILSSEGLFAHWWDFSPAGRAALSALAARLKVELWVFFREPQGYIRSEYVQMLKNPVIGSLCYGRDLSIDEMLDDAWFARRLDYIGYIRDVQAVLGADAVRLFRYGCDTISRFMSALGISGLPGESLREHPTLGEVGTQLLRVINRRTLDAPSKQAVVGLVERIDAIMGAQSEPLTFSLDVRQRIASLAAPSLHALEREFGLYFDSSSGQG
ncbi:MAG: hypothetical protein JO264_04115 [Acidisphaera sp.]|nr:hypothetical protein [Acidisphaera sp.]